MKSPFDLTGKHIIVTGASSGIGQQCAVSCAQMGARLTLMGRNEPRLQQTLCGMINPDQHRLCVVDLTDFDQIGQVVTEAVEAMGLIHGLINCAGISTTLPLKLMKPDVMKTFFDVNVISAFNLTKEVCGRGHFEKEGGSIVFISSIMGSVGEKGKTLYGMTKGAILAGTRSLACELASRNIRVNTISPGAIITPINENQPHISDPEKRKILEDQHLLGLGKTDDIANACVYLLSDASRWVTGTNLFVDGGYTAR